MLDIALIIPPLPPKKGNPGQSGLHPFRGVSKGLRTPSFKKIFPTGVGWYGRSKIFLRDEVRGSMEAPLKEWSQDWPGLPKKPQLGGGGSLATHYAY